MYVESMLHVRADDDLPLAGVADAQAARSIPVGSASELTLTDVAQLLAGRSLVVNPLVGGDAETDVEVVESFLREAAKEGPVSCLARIIGKVEFRAGEGPLFEIAATAVEIETSWADALFSWADDVGRAIAAMPLNNFSLYLVQGIIVLAPQSAPTGTD